MNANGFSTTSGELQRALGNEFDNYLEDSNPGANMFDSEVLSQYSWSNESSIIHAAGDNSSTSMPETGLQIAHAPSTSTSACSEFVAPTDEQKIDDVASGILAPSNTCTASSQMIVSEQIHAAPPCDSQSPYSSSYDVSPQQQTNNPAPTSSNTNATSSELLVTAEINAPVPVSQSACSSSSALLHQLESKTKSSTVTSSNSSFSLSMPPTPPGTPSDFTNQHASSSFSFQTNAPAFQGQRNHMSRAINPNMSSKHAPDVAGPTSTQFSPWIPKSQTGVEAKSCYSKHALKASNTYDPIENSILVLSQALIDNHIKESEGKAKKESEEKEDEEKKVREEKDKQRTEEDNAMNRSVRAFANMVAEELLKMPEHIIANRKGRISAIIFEPLS